MTRPERAPILLRKARQDELVLERLLGGADVDDETLGFHAPQVGEHSPCPLVFVSPRHRGMLTV